MTLSKQLKFNRANIDLMSLTCPGVYVFWFNRMCVYVGKSDRPIRDRLREHWSSCHNADLRIWIRAYGTKLCFQWECVSEGESIRAREQYYIDNFKPLTNKIDSESKTK